MITPYYQESGITIYRGDCLEVLPQLEDKSIDLVLTDPPYNFEACGGGFYGVKWHGKTNEPREYLNKLKNISCDKFEPSQVMELLKFESGYFFCNKTLITKYLNYAEKKHYFMIYW